MWHLSRAENTAHSIMTLTGCHHIGREIGFTNSFSRHRFSRSPHSNRPMAALHSEDGFDILVPTRYYQGVSSLLEKKKSVRKGAMAFQTRKPFGPRARAPDTRRMDASYLSENS